VYLLGELGIYHYCRTAIIEMIFVSPRLSLKTSQIVL